MTPHDPVPDAPLDPPGDVPVDAAVGADVAAVIDATDRLLATTVGLSDSDVARPSLLPGWSVGHVLTHVARNADGLERLVDWAQSGVPSPMYASWESRERDIEQGSRRRAAALHADVRSSAERVAASLARLAALGPEALDRLVLFGAPTPGREPDAPARTLAFARLREVELHHVDLGLPDYGPAQWPDTFVTRTLGWIRGRAGDDGVTGDPATVLAWRIGRGSGEGLVGPEGTTPGEPPPWM